MFPLSTPNLRSSTSKLSSLSHENPYLLIGSPSPISRSKGSKVPSLSIITPKQRKHLVTAKQLVFPSEQTLFGSTRKNTTNLDEEQSFKFGSPRASAYRGSIIKKDLSPNSNLKESFLSRTSRPYPKAIETGVSPDYCQSESVESGLLKKVKNQIVHTEAAPGYQSPTISAMKRVSVKVTKRAEENFDFSMDHKNLYEYGSPSYKNKSMGGWHFNPVPQTENKDNLVSPTQEKNESLKVQGKKSIFHHQPKRLEINSESPRLKREGQLNGVTSNKEERRKKVSCVLTKELEARYGIKLFDSDSSESDQIEKESPNTVVSVDNVSVFNPGDGNTGEAPSPVKNNELLIKLEDVKETESENIATTQHTETQSVAGSTDIFASGKGTFFNFNASNVLVRKLEKSLSIALSSQKDEQKAGPVMDGSKGKAMIAAFSKNKQIVQPEFMKNTGSMCITELWSRKTGRDFTRLMKDKATFVKILDSRRKDECLYRPKRWKEEERVMTKLNTKEFGTNILKTEIKLKTLPSIGIESSIMNSMAKSPQERSLVNNETLSQQQRPKGIKMLRKLVKEELMIEKTKVSRQPSKLLLSRQESSSLVRTKSYGNEVKRGNESSKNLKELIQTKHKF